jgi:hypothetical protein
MSVMARTRDEVRALHAIEQAEREYRFASMRLEVARRRYDALSRERERARRRGHLRLLRSSEVDREET